MVFQEHRQEKPQCKLVRADVIAASAKNLQD
jgi:hypothetical protein